MSSTSVHLANRLWYLEYSSIDNFRIHSWSLFLSDSKIISFKLRMFIALPLKSLFKEMITTKGKNGTGIGLFMSYSNIKAQFNGDIQFKSEVGKGSTFVIIIPISK